MKDENRNQNSVDGSTEPSSRVQAEGLAEVLLPPSLWGKTILHPKARSVNPEIMELERFATRYVEQSAS